ncbi:MAG: hypothetical protein ACR2IH_03350 [Pyrinomonadaceae bacterium]
MKWAIGRFILLLMLASSVFEQETAVKISGRHNPKDERTTDRQRQSDGSAQNAYFSDYDQTERQMADE